MESSAKNGSLPGHYELTQGQIAFSCLSIAAAALLVSWLGYRIASQLDLLQWWVPVALLGGLAAADFGSGLVHWAADTWGRDDCPVIGPRLLVPFRVHHVNPDDFLRRRFVDTNGEVAAVAVPLLLALLAVPARHLLGQAVAVFGLAFCGSVSSRTRSISGRTCRHRRAPVRALQACGLLLGRTEHAALTMGVRTIAATASPPDGVTAAGCDRILPAPRIGDHLADRRDPASRRPAIRGSVRCALARRDDAQPWLTGDHPEPAPLRRSGARNGWNRRRSAPASSAACLGDAGHRRLRDRAGPAVPRVLRLSPNCSPLRSLAYLRGRHPRDAGHVVSARHASARVCARTRPWPSSASASRWWRPCWAARRSRSVLATRRRLA